MRAHYLMTKCTHTHPSKRFWDIALRMPMPPLPVAQFQVCTPASGDMHHQDGSSQQVRMGIRDN